MVFPTAMMRRASQDAAAETHLSASAPSVPDEISIALDRLSTNRVRPTGLRRRLRAAQTLNSFSVYSRSRPDRLPKPASSLDENPCRIDRVCGNLGLNVFRHFRSRLMLTRRPVD